LIEIIKDYRFGPLRFFLDMGGYDLEIFITTVRTCQILCPQEFGKGKQKTGEGVFYEQTNVYRSGGIEAQAQACRISTYKFRR
jgi:hypothetical protein